MYCCCPAMFSFKPNTTWKPARIVVMACRSAGRWKNKIGWQKWRRQGRWLEHWRHLVRDANCQHSSEIQRKRMGREATVWNYGSASEVKDKRISWICKAQGFIELHNANPDLYNDAVSQTTTSSVAIFFVCFRPCLVLKNFHPKVSYRILRHMHGVLNVDEKKTNYTVGWEIARRNFQT